MEVNPIILKIIIYESNFFLTHIQEKVLINDLER